MSVMNGFREELIKSLSGINGDLIIYESSDQDITNLENKYPDAKIVKNYQQRVISTNEQGIEGLLMKSLTIEDFYKIPRLNENLFEISNISDNWVFIGTEFDESIKIKCGVSVGKRSFKKAVDRIRVKRLMREAYRLNKNTYFNKITTQYAFMILYIGKDGTDFETVNHKMKQLNNKFLEAVSE